MRDPRQGLECQASGCAAPVVVELLLQGDQRPRLADLADRVNRREPDGEVGIGHPSDQLVPGSGDLKPSERPHGREPHRAGRVR